MLISSIFRIHLFFATFIFIKIIIVIFRYMKDTNQKTNIKPPDLWIHHDQMELKALEKSSINGEASTSGVASNTLPRSNNQEYNQENVHGNSSSLDKRTDRKSVV